MTLPYTPIARDYHKDGCYCAIGWQLHCEGKTNEELAACNNDQLPAPSRVYIEPDVRIEEFNDRLTSIYLTNDNTARGETRFETAYLLAEQLKKDMPKEWALFVACFNGIPPEIDAELIDED